MNVLGIWIFGFGVGLDIWKVVSSKAKYEPFKLIQRITTTNILFSIGRLGKMKQYKWEYKKIVNLE